MELKSRAKINIGLHVHNLRSDGFHNISTLFQEISLHDSIKIEEADNFSCKTDCGNIPESDNFCTKAFRIAKKLNPELPNVSISINKAIPMNAGLGGGSSNGTAVLKRLKRSF